MSLPVAVQCRRMPASSIERSEPSGAKARAATSPSVWNRGSPKTRVTRGEGSTVSGAAVGTGVAMFRAIHWAKAAEPLETHDEFRSHFRMRREIRALEVEKPSRQGELMGQELLLQQNSSARVVRL